MPDTMLLGRLDSPTSRSDLGIGLTCNVCIGSMLIVGLQIMLELTIMAKLSCGSAETS